MPAVALRPMTAEEYRQYLAWSVPDYAAEVRRNAGIGEAEALRHAERVFADLLPKGFATPGHRLLVATDRDTGERVGLLWIAEQPREGTSAAWIYDIRVEEPLRGRGYGRALMEVAEEQARDMGLARIELNVFGDNPVARAMYERLGYVEMSRQLFKDL